MSDLSVTLTRRVAESSSPLYPERYLIVLLRATLRYQGQRFALPGSAVSEILPSDQPVYYVPGLPASTEGVLHLRGNIESVISLNSLLGLSTLAAPPSGMILLVKAAGI